MKQNDARQKFACIAITGLASLLPTSLTATADNTSDGEAEKIIEEANKLDSAAKRKEALQLLDKAILKNPISEPLHTFRAKIRREERDQAGAVADLNQSITLNPKKKELFIERARILLRVSQLEAAQLDVNHALKLNPDDNEAVTLRGGLYFKLNLYNRALQDLDRALSRDPKNRDAYFYRGAVKYKQKDLKAAIEDFSKAIELDPANTDTYHSRGCAYGELGEYKKALADFNTAEKGKHMTGHIYFNSGRVYRLTKQYDKAIADFNLAIRSGIEEKDASAFIFLERAKTYLALGRTHQALIDVNHSIRTHNRDPRGYLLRAQIYRRMGNADGELKEVAKAKELGAKVSGLRPSQSPSPD